MSATSVSPASNASTKPFHFTQIWDDSQSVSIGKTDFLAAPFEQLCPRGGCVAACNNLSRVFQPVPDPFSERWNVDSYGKPDGDGNIQVTLFGLCSNLNNASSLAHAEGSAAVQRFFPEDSAPEEPTNSFLSNPISQTMTAIATCFSDSCGQTRYPEGSCKESCAVYSLLEDGSLSFDINSLRKCAHSICSSHTVLPFANQDVLGVGVLYSYYIQSVLLLLLAAMLVVSLTWQALSKNEETPRLVRKLKSSMDSFLAAQAYFSISVAIASFLSLKPSTLDPLNGYALLTSVTMGFMGPVFTLMLLHSQEFRSWFATALALISWFLNTGVFFVLARTLSSVDNAAMQDGTNQLFKISNCGGLSALSLCQQLTSTNPMADLNTFFLLSPSNDITSIRSVPILWAWTTLVLICMVIGQIAWTIDTRKNGNSNSSEEKQIADRRWHLPRWLRFVRLPTWKASLVFAGSAVFTLFLIYEFLMVLRYRQMGVIDMKNWSFGQVVAVLFWAPPMLDAVHSILTEEREEHGGRLGFMLGRKESPIAVLGVDSSRPASADDLSDVEDERNPLRSAWTAPPNLGSGKLGGLQKRRTIRMEEGE